MTRVPTAVPGRRCWPCSKRSSPERLLFDDDRAAHSEGGVERVGAAQPIGSMNRRQPYLAGLSAGHVDRAVVELGTALDRGRAEELWRRKIMAAIAGVGEAQDDRFAGAQMDFRGLELEAGKL